MALQAGDDAWLVVSGLASEGDVQGGIYRAKVTTAGKKEVPK